MGSKFLFFQWKIHFSQLISIDKYLKFKQIENFIHYIKCEMRPVFNSSLDSKFGFLNVGFRVTSVFFSNSQKEKKIAFNVAPVGLLNFFQFMK